jgi:Arc/MetJ family transcription regulator
VEYDSRMKVKTSVTLSADVVAAVAKAARRHETRSAAIERLLRERLSASAREEEDRRELERINAHADRLNAEAADVLAYQVDI